VLKRSDKPRKVVWTREDIKAFLDVAYGSFKWRNLGLIVQMAHEWGQRMGDMRMLKWVDYNLDTGVLSMEQSKRRARISVPSSQGLQEMLRQQHEEYGWQQYIAPSNMADRMGGLLPYSQTNLARVADQVRKKAGVASELRLMDLRRTAVTEMIEAEVPLPNIMAMTGHATPQSVAPYLKHTLKGATVAARMRGFV
jgi:integrase